MSKYGMRHLLASLVATIGLTSVLVQGNVVNNLSPAPGVKFSQPPAAFPGTTANFKTPVGTHLKIHKQHGQHTNARSAVAALGVHQRLAGGYGYENITVATAYGTQYAVQVLWGGVPFNLLLDTGSSDTWLAWDNFTCLDTFGNTVSQSTCNLGPGYPGPDFEYGSIPGQHLYSSYADSELVMGPMGYSDITLGNITVRRQEVALANETYWEGNNMTSGLLGLGYPSITNAYQGSTTEHDSFNRIEYDPLFTTMVNQGLVPPVFSIAINRNGSDGVLAFGGIPPIAGANTNVVATCEILITNLIGSSNPEASLCPSFYTIIPDGLVWGLTMDTRQLPYIVDSGTTLIYTHPDIAEAVANAWTPPAQLLTAYGAYFAVCSAVPPPFGVTLDGWTFWVNPRDMIYPALVDPETGLCMTAVAPGGTGPFVLGDAFLQNVVAVFDIGTSEMHFIPHEF